MVTLLRSRDAPLALSEDQQRAMQAIADWRAAPHTQQTLTLAGLAGTGKSTLVSFLAKEWPRAGVAALCGKAADVLRQKGVKRAQTIHSLIYEALVDDETDEVVFVRRNQLVVPKNPEQGNVRGMEVVPAERVIIDEASMPSADLWRDLFSFKLPVLAVGDHGQLAPIGEDLSLMRAPDIRLDHIHRQAAGNPILQFAHALREGKSAPYSYSHLSQKKSKGRGNTGENKRALGVQLGDRWLFEQLMYDPAYQIICGFNATRLSINMAIRQQRGYTGPLPEPGERILCLRNNREFNLFNGQQFDVLACGPPQHGTVELRLRDDEGGYRQCWALAEQFGAPLVEDHRDREVCLFDYGYCLTCHKSQGAEYDKVLVLEQIGGSWDAARWRYTAATRAREQLVWCQV